MIRALSRYVVLVHCAQSRRTYTSVIKACAKSEPADLALACEAADKMMSAKVSLDVYSLTELLRCCARANPPRADVAENVFRTHVRPKSLHDHVKWALEESVGAQHAFSLMSWARSKYPRRT
eukprot:m.673054 g.673054  ORF g.673054 m.673054 type:complete len:122 (-) comp22777_c0_seq21:197-562(-)